MSYHSVDDDQFLKLRSILITALTLPSPLGFAKMVRRLFCSLAESRRRFSSPHLSKSAFWFILQFLSWKNMEGEHSPCKQLTSWKISAVESIIAMLTYCSWRIAVNAERNESIRAKKEDDGWSNQCAECCCCCWCRKYPSFSLYEKRYSSLFHA